MDDLLDGQKLAPQNTKARADDSESDGDGVITAMKFDQINERNLEDFRRGVIRVIQAKEKEAEIKGGGAEELMTAFEGLSAAFWLKAHCCRVVVPVGNFGREYVYVLKGAVEGFKKLYGERLSFVERPTSQSGERYTVNEVMDDFKLMLTERLVQLDEIREKETG